MRRTFPIGLSVLLAVVLIASGGALAAPGTDSRASPAVSVDATTGPSVQATVGPAALPSAQATTVTASNDSFRNETAVSGLVQPVELAFLPDGRMLILQKSGKLLIANRTTGNTSTYLDISASVWTDGERGLLGIAIDPNVTENGSVYLYYTNDSTDANRISRFTHVENGGGLDSYADPSSEVLLWENPYTTREPERTCCHFGGGLDVGPDGRLYLTTGEEFLADQAQNLSRADGKVIRINRDGSVPETNPFVDDPDALDSIWAYGLRNPWSAQWDLPTERLFIAEVGGNDDDVATEDVHLGASGANYGWPDCEGFCSNDSYADPVYAYPHNGSGASVTGGPVYRGSQFPDEYAGMYFFGDYVRGWIHALAFNDSGGVTDVVEFYQSPADDVGNAHHDIVDIQQGPEGALYYADIAAGTIRRIVYEDENRAPVITSAGANTTAGDAPLAVAFNATASDPDSDPLSYRWVFGDGTDAAGRNVTHTYESNGSYDAYVEVSDGNTTSRSDPITIRVGSPPNATITAPENGSLFRAGDTIVLNGTAPDPEDGELSGDAFSWTVRFVHDEHTHPAVDDLRAKNGSFEIPTSGHDYDDRTGYEIELTVTDSDGLTDTERVYVLPDRINQTIATNRTGLEIEFDGIPRATPYERDTLIGFNHTVTAPSPQCVDGTAYEFVSWSDGGNRSHTVTTPDTDQSLLANYTASGTCGLVTDGLVLSLAADSGVATDGGTVTGWTDRSGLGNDLTASGDPALRTGALNGHDVIDFDGEDDLLERTATLSGFPSGSANRTVFYVVRYDGAVTPAGGFAFGAPNCNRAFGLTVDGAGEMMLQGWCSTNDYPSGVAGANTGWMTQSVRLAGDAFTHYRNGSAIDSGTHAFDTRLDRLVLGAEMTPAPYVDMAVAEVLVYDRALTGSERQQVEDHLRRTYFESSTTNTPPTARNDSATVVNGSSIEIDVLANDTDPDGTINASSVTIRREPTSGTATVDGSTGVVTYDHDGSGTTDDSFTYTVADDDGNTSNEATVSIDVTATNAAPTARNDSATVVNGSSVEIDVLANDTDPDGSLDPSSVTIRRGATNGTVTVDGSTGVVTYDHDGSGTADDDFTYTVADDLGATSEEATVSISVENGTTGGLVTDGLVLRLESGSAVSTSGGNVTGWADGSGLGNDLTADGDPTLLSNATPSGASAVSFDGEGDALTRTDTLSGLPTGNANRTVFLVANYRSTGFGGFGYGRAGCNRAFGLGVNDDPGELMVQGWCSANDYVSGVQGTGAGWLSHAALHEDGQLSQYRNGTLIDTASHAFDTASDSLVLGAELTPAPYLDMEVAAVLVYDRALTESERRQVEEYVSETYLDPTPGSNEPPVARNDSATVVNGSSVEIDVLANDSDPDGTLNASSVTIRRGPTNGSVTVDGSTGVVTYDHDGSGTATDSFTYTVADDDGNTSTEATVSVTVLSETEALDRGLVGHWRFERTSGPVVDASGNGLNGTNSGATRGVEGLNGSNAFAFDGTSSYVDLPEDSSLPTGDSSYAMSVWFRATGDQEGGLIGWGDYGTCRGSNALRVTAAGAADAASFKQFWWCEDLIADTSVAYNDSWHHVVATYDGNSRQIWLDGALVAEDAPPSNAANLANAAIGLTDEEYFEGRIDEVRVYDRALNATEITRLCEEYGCSGS